MLRHLQVYIVSLEIRDDLLHNAGICITVIIRYIKSDTLLFADLLKAGLDVVYDLVQGSVIYIVADTYLEIIRHYR